MKNDQQAVITGDVIHSREGTFANWMTALKSALHDLDQTDKAWDIFRGDSFQLALRPEDALLAAFYIKARIKQKGMHDVRMAIGIGTIHHRAETISESQGSAFLRSGTCFDQLKKRTIGLYSECPDLDTPMNIMLDLLTLTIDNWSKVSAMVIQTAIRNPEATQSELANRLQKTQSNISEALKRGGYEPMMNVNEYFLTQLKRQ